MRLLVVSFDSTYADAPAQQPEHGLSFLAEVLEAIDDQPVIEALDQHYITGRPGYQQEAMLRAVFAKYILSIRFTRGLIDQLHANPRLREVCGFGKAVPSESTFSRFFARLRQHTDLIEEAVVTAVDGIQKHLPDLGEIVAVDGTSVDTFASPQREPATDPSARWGYKNSARSKDNKQVLFFGYRMHMIADAKYGTPLSFTLTAANGSEMTELPKLLTKAKQEHPWLKPEYLLADRGYDSKNNHKFVLSRGITPIIHIRKPGADDGLYDGIFDKKGRPTCLGGVPMNYVGTSKKNGHHLFECPPEGCALKGNGLVPNCQDRHWFSPDTNPRVLGPVPRFTNLWKSLYDMRMSVERTFRSLKHSRGLQHHTVRRLEPMRLHLNLAVLTYLATSLAHLRAGRRDQVAKMSVTLS